MASDIVHVMFDIPKDTHRCLKQLAVSRECTLRSMLQETVQHYITAAPEFQGTVERKREYMEPELCETVFYLSRYAECLEIDKRITVPDERELMWMIYDWARKFEQEYDPGGEKDHSVELETQGPRWLLDTFPYMPEMNDKRQVILEFIETKASTAEIWPWALSKEEMIQNEELLQKVEEAVQFEAAVSFDTDELYEALDKIVGINPELRDEHTFSLEMS